jgi:hypothetical protein
MTTQIISEQVFALLRNALWGKEIDFSLFPEGETDWNAIQKFISKQTLIGLIADAVIRNAEQLKPGKETLRALTFKLASIKQSHALLNERLADIVGMMTANDIPSVLFKGQGIARLYPTPELRQCGDIDLYIGHKNIDKAFAIMTDLQLDDESIQESDKHIHLSYKGVDVELHRIAETLPSPIANHRWQKWTIEQLTNGKLIHYDFNGVDVATPPVEFNTVFIFNHLYHHFITGGIGLRQLCDWAMLLHTYHNQIDIDTLRTNLKRYNLLEVWQYFICILVDKIGLPTDEALLYNPKNSLKNDYILQHIFTGGNFGHYREISKRPDGYFAGKLHSFKNATKYIFSMRLISFRSMLTTFLSYLYNGILAIIYDKLHINRVRK